MDERAFLAVIMRADISGTCPRKVDDLVKDLQPIATGIRRGGGPNPSAAPRRSTRELFTDSCLSAC